MLNRSFLLHPSSQEIPPEEGQRRNLPPGPAGRVPTSRLRARGQRAPGGRCAQLREPRATRRTCHSSCRAPAQEGGERGQPRGGAARQPGDPGQPRASRDRGCASPALPPSRRLPAAPGAALLQWLRRRARRPRDPGPAFCAPPHPTPAPAGSALPAASPPPASDLFLRAVESLLDVLGEDARLDVGHGCRSAEAERSGAGGEEERERRSRRGGEEPPSARRGEGGARRRGPT